MLVVFLLAFGVGASSGCSKSPNPARTTEGQPQPISKPSLPALAQSTPTPGPASVKDNTAPKTEEVNDAVVRVFSKAATVDSNYQPSMLVGDFNGDGSQDIAVVVKPNADALAEINNELANWTLEDVKETDQSTRPRPVKAEKTDTLIAIIHGVGPKGWRNPEARQTFLLRNATGTDLLAEPAKQSPTTPPTSRLPTSTGDVIRETINGHRGLIYWNGARYALRLTSD